MPYVPVNKDLSKVKNKVIFNKLTLREGIFFAIGITLSFLSFFTIHKFNKDMATIVMVVVMVPFPLFALYQKEGQKPEDLLMQYAERKKRQTERPYVSENIYELMKEREQMQNEIQEILLKAKKQQKESIAFLKSLVSKKKSSKEVKNNKSKQPQRRSAGKTGSRKEEKAKQPIKISPNMILDPKTKLELKRAMDKAKHYGKIPESAQQTIPYRRPYKNGIFESEEGYFTITIMFDDISYKLASNDVKNTIFENYCDLLNYFDQSIHFQISFYNQETSKKDIEKSITVELKGDEFDTIISEINTILKDNLEKGNNGLDRNRYITVGIHTKTYQEAKTRLSRIETDIMNLFLKNGVASRRLNGYERLKLLHDILNSGGHDPFLFNWDAVLTTGCSSKDFIAPTSFDFKDSSRLDAKRYFRMGDRIGAANFMSILAPDLPDDLLPELLALNSNLIVNLHFEAIDQNKAMNIVKKQLSDIQSSKVNEQMKANAKGYDMDILPPELEASEEAAKSLYADLQKRNERLFNITITTVQTCKSRKELDDNIYQANGIVQKYNCPLKRLDNRQEQGLVSSLPLGINQIKIKRSLTTSPSAAFVPFATEELFQEAMLKKNGFNSIPLYYGMNAISHNMIMADRGRLGNPNGLYLGKPGYGKSMAAKREMAFAYFLTTDDMLILDPEGEYKPFIQLLKGQMVELSLKSTDYINPLDIDLDLGENEEDRDYDPISEKCDFITSLCELILGGKQGLTPIQISIIDQCSRNIYQKYIDNPIPENMPILGDLYEELKKHEQPEARNLAVALNLYVNGSLNYFNHRTNVDLTNRLVCFDLKKLQKNLRKIGMLIIQDQIWFRVAKNRDTKKTRVYIDEFHLLFKEPQTAEYSVEIWKRFRKWGGIPTGLTQNVTDLLISKQVESIFKNSDFIIMLNQSRDDGEQLADFLDISEHQCKYMIGVTPGRGLLCYGDTIIPFYDDIPGDTLLYAAMSTKPGEAVNIEELVEKMNIQSKKKKVRAS